MKDLKIGDKLMVETFSSWSRKIDVVASEVIKINKSTYKLSNGTLVYKEDLSIRGDRFAKYRLFNQREYDVIKEKAFNHDVNVYVKRIKENRLTDIKKLKLAIKILEQEDES